jgi:hypothetical protein
VSRSGRVTARDVADRWWLLSVYDDGWCAEPVVVPTPEETRRRVRALLGWLLAVLALFAASAAAAVLVPGAPWLTWLLLAASLGTLGGAGLQAARRRARRRPPVFGSSAEHLAAVDGVTRVARGSVRAVSVGRQGHEDVVTIAVRRGKPVVYRSPDRTLGRLFTAWSPPPPRS